MTVLLIPIAPQLGVEPIVVVAAATIIGGIGADRDPMAAVASGGLWLSPGARPSRPGPRACVDADGPGTIGLAATQINIFVNTRFATDQGTGAVAALDYAFRVMYLPIGLFGVSIAAASTPALSRLVAANNRAEMRSTVASAIGLMLALNVPATLGLVALATPIIALIFEHGRFTADDTAATARALQFYAVGLVGYRSCGLCPRLLRAAAQPYPGDRECRFGDREHLDGLRAGSRDGIRGPGVGHVTRGDSECGDAALLPAAGTRRHSGGSYPHHVREDDGGGGADGGFRMVRGIVAARCHRRQRRRA